MNGRTQPPIHPFTHSPIHPFTHHPPTHSPIHTSPPLVSPAPAQESMEDMRFTSHDSSHPPLPASSHTCGTPAVRDTDCTIVPNGSPTDLQRCTGCTVLYCTVLYCTVLYHHHPHAVAHTPCPPIMVIGSRLVFIVFHRVHTHNLEIEPQETPSDTLWDDGGMTVR